MRLTGPSTSTSLTWRVKASRSRRFETYASRLLPLCGDNSVVDPPDASEISANDCRLYLDRWRDHAPGTRYHSWAVLSGCFKFLYRAEVISQNPMERVEPPKRLSPEELDVVTVSGADVRKLFDVCETWAELLCLSTLAYLGPRRGAVSKLRWSDVDLEHGMIRFREKGRRRSASRSRWSSPPFYARRCLLAKSTASRTTTWCRCSASRSMATNGTIG